MMTNKDSNTDKKDKKMFELTLHIHFPISIVNFLDMYIF